LLHWYDILLMMLRIAFVIHTFQAGGLERCVARLASHVDRAHFHPIIICLSRSGSGAKWLEADDVPVFELNKRAGNDPGLIFRFCRLLRAERVQVVHSHNWGSLIETVIARLMGSVPLHVHAERGLELGEMQAGRVRRHMRSLTSRAALLSSNAVVAVSREIRDRLVSSGVPANRVHLIPNGIDPVPVRDAASERQRIRHELGLNESTILGCSISRLTPVKNLGLLSNSVALLTRDGLYIHIVIVGEGPEHDALRMATISAGVSNRVHFVGERADVGSWLAAADIYLNSSLYEGMSQAVLEAMGAGLPLVVTDVGENAALVLDESPCGRVVPSGDVQAFASALSELCKDATLRKQFGQRARERQLRKYSRQRMVELYENLYTKVARGKVPAFPPMAR
jgi:sugar transferase (PEP-CTERM/EpsH1 system associated)